MTIIVLNDKGGEVCRVSGFTSRSSIYSKLLEILVDIALSTLKTGGTYHLSVTQGPDKL